MEEFKQHGEANLTRMFQRAKETESALREEIKNLEVTCSDFQVSMIKKKLKKRNYYLTTFVTQASRDRAMKDLATLQAQTER
jgi:hypothetical protein